MENLEFLMNATKVIVENCCKVKHEFSKKITQIFDENKNFFKNQFDLPKKRKTREIQPKKTRKSKKTVQEIPSSSESGSENEYNSNSFSKISKISIPSSKEIDLEIKEVFSSDDHSLFSSDLEESNDFNSYSELESIYDSLVNFNSSPLENLRNLKSLLVNFEKLSQTDKISCMSLLSKLTHLKYSKSDEKLTSLNTEIQEIISKILKNSNYKQDWKLVLKQINEAALSNNNEKINQILKVINSSFPSALDENLIQEMEPLFKQIRIVSETFAPSETKNLASLLMKRWTKSLNESGSVKEAKFKEILKKSVDLSESKKGIKHSLMARNANTKK